jgi:ADP-heptose:LPS heptosyltransferase
VESQLEASPASSVIGEKILIIFPGALGDFICFFPALQRLACGREVDLFARTEYGDLLPQTIRIRSLESYFISRLFAPGAEQDERLESFFGSYGAIWSWIGKNEPNFVRHLSVLSKGRLRIFSFRPANPGLHAADYYLSCLEENLPTGSISAIPLRSDGIAWSDGFWRRHRLQEKKVLALAPGSGSVEKNWPAGFYKVVAEWWERALGGRAVVVLGPVEEEQTSVMNFWGSLLVARGLSLAQLAALLNRSDLYLGNDSGVTHLAAMVGVETVALFGPTAVAQWAPRGRRVTTVDQKVECAACVPSVMKDCPHRKCLAALHPNTVIRILREIASDFVNGAVGKQGFLTRGGAEIKVQI